MWREAEPDSRVEVTIDGGHKVVAYSFGSADETVFCLNGGPGLPCDYLREAHSWLVDHGFRVVAFDQLGCGAADRPTDPALWTIERYVQETEAVRQALDLGKVHLLGHSWGGWLGIDYALAHPEALKSLILEDTVADMPASIAELERLRSALGADTVAMMQRYEAEGRYDHPEYMAAITLLNYRHVCRLSEWPAPVNRSLSDWNPGPYGAMQGPNEFHYTGNLKDWSRLAELPTISVPTLITCGRHDEFTPAGALKMKLAIPGAEMKVFPNSSHMPFYEEPEAYAAALLDFLSRVAGRPKQSGR